MAVSDIIGITGIFGTTCTAPPYIEALHSLDNQPYFAESFDEVEFSMIAYYYTCKSIT